MGSYGMPLNVKLVQFLKRTEAIVRDLGVDNIDESLGAGPAE